MREAEIIALEKFKARIWQLLRANRDVVANSDKELGQTHIEDEYLYRQTGADQIKAI